jgi:hypothetical protein
MESCAEEIDQHSRLEEAPLSSPNRINEGIDSRIMAASYDIHLLLATYWLLGGIAGLPWAGFPGGIAGGTLQIVIANALMIND